MGAIVVVGIAGVALVALSMRPAEPAPTAVVPRVAPSPARESEPDPPVVADAPPAEGAVDLDLSDLAPAPEAAAAPVARRRRVASPTPPPAVAPADERPGRVNVVTRGGWADVYLRGRRLGRTPRSVELPPGDHVLELRPFGQAPGREVRVRVEPGGVERVVEPVSR